MSNLRFASAREVFETFPTIARDITAKISDAAPLDYLNDLVASRTPEDAISFCAYLLDRRQAVWWSCSCSRLNGSPANRDEELALLAAEAWVRDPQPPRRSHALQLGLNGDRDFAGAWAALAAGGAGGTLDIDGQPGPPVVAHMTAQAARTCVLIAVATRPMRERAPAMIECVDLARKILADG